MVVHLIALFYFIGSLQRIRACILGGCPWERSEQPAVGSEPPQGTAALSWLERAAQLIWSPWLLLSLKKEIYTKAKAQQGSAKLLSIGKCLVVHIRKV